MMNANVVCSIARRKIIVRNSCVKARSSSACVTRKPIDQLYKSRIRNKHIHPSLQFQYFFSTTSDDKNDKEKKQPEQKKKKSLRDTLNDINSESEAGKTTVDSNEFFFKAASAFDSFKSNVSETWEELINSNQAKDINKKIHQSKAGDVKDDDNEAADKYEGTTAMMVIDESENLTAYERIQKRLGEAPIIQGIFSTAEKVYEQSGAAQAKEKISHIREDAEEAWETSQNPWVYRASSVYDTLTAESEEALVERELRDLDPDFSLETWKRDAVEVTLPRIMKMFLEGQIKDLKPHLGEAVYNRLAAESRARKKEGVYIDTNVLAVMNAEILSCNPDTVNKGSPIIVLHFMCQQINCVRKKEGNEIVEGSEDDIRANSYVVAFQREHDEEKGELNWKMVDFMPNGAVAYI